MKSYLIKNAKVVNENQCYEANVYIENHRIVCVGDVKQTAKNTEIIEAKNQYLIPGCIDDQVHFREPGLTHKADIATESKAAVAGGITSYFEMPNTNPQTLTMDAWQQKIDRAAKTSWANYSFMFGVANDNLADVKQADYSKIPALKIFLGSSTGNMLVDDDRVLNEVFKFSPVRIALHCEDEQTIKENLERVKAQYGSAIPISKHPEIRDVEACYKSSSSAVQRAINTGGRIHVFHLSTAKEMALFDNKLPIHKKQITSEVCIHHLWFCDEDYEQKGTHIKWNPSVKSKADREALWKALLEDKIDVIATDHAPHTLEEKNNNYEQAPSGGPLVQHALPAMMEFVKQGKISIEKVVEKMCHNPAILFDIKDRGFIKPGYKADLVLIDPNNPWTVSKENILYKCGWSPFEGYRFNSKIT
ncbi:MAG: dihydroorotase, partial [Flavobacteriaceae bacterium]|nr:dihydroorotase [Flavobacteriaceae bacterium]